MESITRFDGQYDFLSNFYHFPIKLEGETYPTAEHAFQAAKTFDPEERKKIQQATTPGNAKRLGKRVKLRDDWEQVKISIMRELLVQKFNDPELKSKLLATEDVELIEGNTWRDRTWGCVNVKGQWVGKNQLGKLLMEIRTAMKEDMQTDQ